MFAPCIKSVTAALVPTVTIGGQPAPVQYAGWVADAIAGLYQVNVKLPTTDVLTFSHSDGTSAAALTVPVRVPVVVTANSKPSQGGVSVWIAPRLKVVGPTCTTDASDKCSGPVGKPWPTVSQITASLGTGPYQYIVSAGTLPAGLSLSTDTNSPWKATITGTPGANTAGTYNITVTATDTATHPVSGTVSFTLTVTGGLMLTMTAPYTITKPFGTPTAVNPQIFASSGTWPYKFALIAPTPTLPKEMTIDPDTGVVSISDLTPAGTYTIKVEATDDSLPTPLKGTFTFTLKIDMLMNPQGSASTTATAASGGAQSIITYAATGATGSINYSIPQAATDLGFSMVGATLTYTSGTGTAVSGTPYTIDVTATAATPATGADSGGAGTGIATVNVTLQ
jgi:hypothetical protein